MTWGKALFLVKINLLARKKTNGLYLILYFLSAIFLVGAASFGTSLFWGVDDYINTAQETGEYRRIQVYCESDKIEELHKYLKGKGEIISYEEDSIYVIELKNYKEKYSVAEEIEGQGIGNSIIDTRVDGNLKILQNLRKASMLCFLITMGGIIAIMNINISQMIGERNHEIGIAYAVGYSANQITLELWAEIALLLALGICMAYGVVVLGEPYVAKQVSELVQYDDIGLWQKGSVHEIAAIVCASITLLLCLQVYSIRRKILKISPMDLILGD